MIVEGVVILEFLVENIVTGWIHAEVL